MTEEIKEILDRLKDSVTNPILNVYFMGNDETINNNKCLEPNECKLLLDYITNLQQDLDKANDIIVKDRQFYKCRMDEYVELKKENERLKEEKLLIESDINNAYSWLKDYKSRCEKAIKYIKSTNCYGMRSGKTLLQKYLYALLNILNGSDKNE